MSHIHHFTISLTALVQALVQANVLKGFGSLDEVSSLRTQYKLAFSKLLQSAIASITPQVGQSAGSVVYCGPVSWGTLCIVGQSAGQQCVLSAS